MIIRGWKVFGNPEIISADKNFWDKFLFCNLDRITTVLIHIPKETKCVVCGQYSLNFTSRSSLANHIKNHARATVNYWLNNIISKSPDELESILYESGNKGVIEY